MKTIRLLPETDLARIALLPEHQKRIELRGVKFGKPPHSLVPLRKVVPATFAAAASLFDLPSRTWSDVEAAVIRYCNANVHWREPNLRIAKLLFDFNAKRANKAVE